MLTSAIIPQKPFEYKPHHKALIAGHLLEGKSITQAQFCDMTSKASRLAPRIMDLRKRGYPIMTNKIKLKDGTYVAEYYLPKRFITLVRNIGISKALTQTQEAV